MDIGTLALISVVMQGTAVVAGGGAMCAAGWIIKKGIDGAKHEIALSEEALDRNLNPRERILEGMKGFGKGALRGLGGIATIALGGVFTAGLTTVIGAGLIVIEAPAILTLAAVPMALGAGLWLTGKVTSKVNKALDSALGLDLPISTALQEEATQWQENPIYIKNSYKNVTPDPHLSQNQPHFKDPGKKSGKR